MFLSFSDSTLIYQLPWERATCSMLFSCRNVVFKGIAMTRQVFRSIKNAFSQVIFSRLQTLSEVTFVLLSQLTAMKVFGQYQRKKPFSYSIAAEELIAQHGTIFMYFTPYQSWSALYAIQLLLLPVVYGSEQELKADV